MNRIQKKCVVASAGMHLLLAAVIFIGPAFTSGPKQTEEIRMIDFVPYRLVDANVAGGGNPNGKSSPPVLPAGQPNPPPQQPPPTPIPAPKIPNPPAETKKAEPEPDKPRPDASSFAETKKQKKALPDIVTTPTVRKVPAASKTTAESDNRERQLLEQQRKFAQAIQRTAAGIEGGSSGATPVDLEDLKGPGGGGLPYAGFVSWVQKVYLDAWTAPDDSASENAVARAKVTIANDGRVIASEIISRSGDAQVDSSVQRTLDRVTTIGRPFPEGVKDKQRSYILKFDLRLKRGLA